MLLEDFNVFFLFKMIEQITVDSKLANFSYSNSSFQSFAFFLSFFLNDLCIFSREFYSIEIANLTT